ncbi:unnamed protein product [Ixodes pacificus]
MLCPQPSALTHHSMDHSCGLRDEQARRHFGGQHHLLDRCVEDNHIVSLGDWNVCTTRNTYGHATTQTANQTNSTQEAQELSHLRTTRTERDLSGWTAQSLR